MSNRTDTADSSPANSLASSIQHTLIRQDVTSEDMARHCDECIEHGFNAAMVGGAWVPFALARLSGTPVAVVSAVDFPPGAMSAASKARAVGALVDAGAAQVDIGTNVGFLLSGLEQEYHDDIAASVAAAGDRPVKVMLELPLLPDDLQRRAVELAVDAGAAFLKNASAGNVGVATPDQVRFLRDAAPARVRVKASGGITSAASVRALLAAGADLVGTSHGVSIVRDLLVSESAY